MRTTDEQKPPADEGPVERRVRPRAWKPSPAMIGVLLLASKGYSLYTYCSNRSEHGARMGTIRALRSRGLLEVNTITLAGGRLLEAA